MASSTESDDNSLVLKTMEELKKTVLDEVEELREELGAVQVLSEEPVVQDQEDVSTMLRTKLQLESEIEAVMRSPMISLPPEPELLLRLAREQSEATAATNAQTLTFYREKVQMLRQEKCKYQNMVDKATQVKVAVGNLRNTVTSLEKLQKIKKRYQRAGLVFVSLREAIQDMLTEFYPKTEEITSMEEILDLLISKALKEPNDPYITIDENMDNGHIEFLLRCNLVVRHREDVSRIRFIDPRP